MSTSQLASSARALVASGKGLLAADESTGTIAKRFEAVGIEHSAPIEDETKEYFFWHIQIPPRVTTIAGFELGSGMHITTMRPEESAAFIRDLMPRREGGPR